MHAIKYLLTFLKKNTFKMSSKIHKLSDLNQLESEKLLKIKDSVRHLFVDGVYDVRDSTVEHFKNVETVEFEEGVREICYHAFRKFEKLVSVKFPVTVRTIDHKAFEGCKNLETIELPRQLNRLGIFVFADCLKLKHVVIPCCLRAVAMGSFHGCSSLETVIFEDEESTQYDYSAIEISEGLYVRGTVRLESGCFKKCVSLRSVKFPRSLQILEALSFFECSSLLYVSLPPTIKFIGNYAFQKCVSLKFFCAPGLLNDNYSSGPPFGRMNGMEEAFFGCNKLETLILGCNRYAFFFHPNMLEGCTGLRNLIFLPGVPGFEDKENIVNFRLPDDCRLLAPDPVIKLLGGKFANKTRKNLEESGLWVDSKTIRRLFFLPEIKSVGFLETLKGMQAGKTKDAVLSFELANQRQRQQQRYRKLPLELTNKITSFLGLDYLDRAGEAPKYVTNKESGIMYYFVDHTLAESAAN